MGQKQPKLHFLAIGDSLTAGYFNRGQCYHPYANYLSTLYSSINISVNINQQGGSSAETMFNEGLKPIYDYHIENGYFSPEDDRDKDRQQLNEMIRHYVVSSKDQERVYLVDLDKAIPYHNINDLNEREIIWDDKIHLKPDGYDRMALLIFETIKNK